MFRRFLRHKVNRDKGLLLIFPKHPLFPRLLRGTFVGNVNLHGSFTFVAGLAASWDVGDQPVPAQTVGASRDDLRLAERRGQESLPFPVLPGYRPMHCLEALLSGGRTANRTRVYINTLASPAARAFRVPGRLEPGCGFDPNFSGDRRPRRTD